jgi:hypothetical protein
MALPPHLPKPLTSAIVLALGCLLLVAIATAAPKAKLWARWADYDRASTATIDHSRWQRFLDTYVRQYADGVNRVAYGAVGAADRRRLDEYITDLAAVPIRAYSRDQQRAYWINLYNALTVRLVLDHYPIKSIRQIKSGLFAIGPWEKKLVTVEGVELSLDDIEHRILRPIWHDPRLHYAVNCASVGCPNLQKRAYTAADTDALLDRGACAYINSARGAEIRRGRLVVSSLYKWYEEDFGGSPAGVIDHLRRYASPALVDELKGVNSIAGYRYDWKLNGASAIRDTASYHRPSVCRE